MARPRKHDGRRLSKGGIEVLWMDYRDRDGKRQRESTNTEDWQEAQRTLRERLQARDDNTLPTASEGRATHGSSVGGFLLGGFSKPPIRAPKTHEANYRVVSTSSRIWRGADGDLTADMIETYLRRRLEQRVEVRTPTASIEKGPVEAQHCSSGISGTSADAECRSSQEVAGGESVRGCRVSRAGQGACSGRTTWRGRSKQQIEFQRRSTCAM